MNQQLENLMYASGLTAQGCWDSMDAYDHKAIEKLAELIVEECITVVIKVYSNTPVELCGPLLTASEQIAEHFYGTEQ